VGLGEETSGTPRSGGISSVHLHGVRLASFVQTQAQARTLSKAVPLLDLILKPVMAEAMNTIINPVVNMMAPAVGEDL